MKTILKNKKNEKYKKINKKTKINMEKYSEKIKKYKKN